MGIKDMRIKRKMTQQKLAELLGVSRVCVTRWELGETNPRAAQYPELAKILKCPIGKLFD